MKLFFVLVCVILDIPRSSLGEALNTLTRDFQLLNYPELKPDTYSNDTFILQFNAFNKQLCLILRRDEEPRRLALKFDVQDRSVVDYVFVKGYLLGVHRSSVLGAMHHGVFFGTIETPTTTFVLHPNNISNTGPAHSMIFRIHKLISASYRPSPKQLRRSRDATDIRTCSMYIRTDTFLWNHMAESAVNPSDLDAVKLSIVNLVHNHVQTVNLILKDTKLEAGGKRIEVQLQLQNLRVETPGSCSNDTDGIINPYCSNKLDTAHLLNLFSKENHEGFCLAYLFTFRELNEDPSGLAWIADPKKPGGICSKFQYSHEWGESSGHIKQSLNTGVLNFNKYNSRIPLKVSSKIFVHEVGHSLGSKHDQPGCYSSVRDTGSIMDNLPIGNISPKNFKFSNCSVQAINDILAIVTKADSNRNCLSSASRSFCGNNRVENGEDCDCGYTSDQCLEKCCYPAVLTDAHLARDSKARGCRLKPNYSCSPSADPCCDSSTCTTTKSWKICRKGNECEDQALCSGYSLQCPASKVRNTTDGTCNKKTQVCQEGVCTGSICQKYGLTECVAEQVKGAVDGQCVVACRFLWGICLGLIETMPGGIEMPLYRLPGAPCRDFKGACDANHRCRIVEEAKTWSKLYGLLLNNGFNGQMGQNYKYVFWGVGIGVAVFFLYPLLNLRRSTTAAGNADNLEMQDIGQ